MKEQDLQKAIALSLIANVGPVLAKQLIRICGGIDAVYTEKKSNLLRIPKINADIAQNIVSKSSFTRAEEEIRFTKEHGIEVYYFQAEQYPSRLKHYKDAPIILYYKGTDIINHKRTMAIVGTRRITPYGQAICSSFTKELADYNVCVFSGLAYGVDTHAHKSCVANGIPTIGV